MANPASRAPSRQFQLEQWDWDVFISHAGQDKRFGRGLHRRVEQVGLRCFLDDMSLRVGCDAAVAMQAAAQSTQVAVLLLSEEFFTKEWPQRELRWFWMVIKRPGIPCSLCSWASQWSGARSLLPPWAWLACAISRVCVTKMSCTRVLR